MTNKKILLFGKNGQLGSRLFHLLHGDNLFAYDSLEINFTEPEKISRLIDQIQPGLIINAAAYTNVDRAESDNTTASTVNGDTVGIIAEKAKKHQAGFIHYSTDFVFNGLKGTPYTEDDQPDPVNGYGVSKLLGEEKTITVDDSYLIFRLSWVYSISHPCFVTKVLGWARKQETLRVVDDQVSNPTWANMVAEKTIEVVRQLDQPWHSSIAEVKGLYHLAGDGQASRFEWAKEILALDPNQQEQIVKSIQPVDSSEFSTPAKRPPMTVLNCNKFSRQFNIDIPQWQKSLREAMGGLPVK